MKHTEASALAYSPALLRIQREAPSPVPRLVSSILLVLVLGVILWAMLSRIDIVAVAPGRLVPSTYLKVVQPADGALSRKSWFEKATGSKRDKCWCAWTPPCPAPRDGN